MKILYLLCIMCMTSAVYSDDLVDELDRFMKEICRQEVLDKTLKEIYGFNQEDRDKWIIQKAKSIDPGLMVLDIGAGTCPYRPFFSHCIYLTHDFKRYEGEKLGGTTQYGAIDFVSEITDIPVPEESFDVIVCTEVLEHVPEPILALREMARILRKGGRLFLTAPFSCGLHQVPYHYYTGFTPMWYEKFLEEYGLDIVEIVPNGGFFKMLSQESHRVNGLWDKHKDLHSPEYRLAIQKLFAELLPRFLYDLDSRCFINQFTVGYHIEARKR